MAEVGRVLDCAADGRGCVLAITGRPGSGRTELAAAAAREGARRGFTVLRTAAMPGEPGALAWARLLADAGAPDELASRVLGDAGPPALDTAARVLSGGNRRLLVIDDIDHGGAAALRLLEAVAARAAAADTAVVVTSVLPLGVGTKLRLTGLSEDELAAVLPGLAPQDRRAVWLASAGLPGVAGSLAADLAADTGTADPLVRLALRAPSQAEFLDINTGLIRLLELAPPQAARAYEFIRVLIGDDRGDHRHGHHRERCRGPDEPVSHSPSSSRQPTTNRSSLPKPPASRSASTMAVIAWFRVNRRPGWHETIQAPCPSAAAFSRNCAVAMTRPSISRNMDSSLIFVDMGGPSPARGSHGSQEREPTYADSPRLTATSLWRSCR